MLCVRYWDVLLSDIDDDQEATFSLWKIIWGYFLVSHTPAFLSAVLYESKNIWLAALHIVLVKLNLYCVFLSMACFIYGAV